MVYGHEQQFEAEAGASVGSMHLKEVDATDVLVNTEMVNANLSVLVGNHTNEDIEEGEEAEEGHLGQVADPQKMNPWSDI